TAATFEAALNALRPGHPARIVVAAPIAAASAVRRLRNQVAEVVVLGEVEPLNDVSLWYRDSSSTTDEEIRYLLERAARHELVLA
ncbi:MAG TPA: phosphoribosyltransferase, partial [Terriglobia bacterium]|nr:phosphoribosyltransferase [Terriglobia bacterium]